MLGINAIRSLNCVSLALSAHVLARIGAMDADAIQTQEMGALKEGTPPRKDGLLSPPAAAAQETPPSKAKAFTASASPLSATLRKYSAAEEAQMASDRATARAALSRCLAATPKPF
jgi:hypothetical protein